MKNKEIAQISGDITTFRENLDEFTPSLFDETLAIAGNAVRGPALVPQTVGSFNEDPESLDTWENIYGNFNEQNLSNGSILSNIWLEQNRQLTYCRVLGIGNGEGIDENKSYDSAGFVVGDSPISGSITEYQKGSNSYSVQNGDPGKTSFLGKYVKNIDLEEYVSPYEDYIEQVTGQGNLTSLGVITDIIFASSGSKLSLQAEEKDMLMKEEVVESLTQNNSSVSILFGENKTTLKFPKLYVQGLTNESKVIIDYEHDQDNFISSQIKTNTVNEDVDYYLYRGHYRYCSFKDTSVFNNVDILQVDQNVVEENKHFIATSSSPWNTSNNSPNFESFESIFTKAKTPWIISQPTDRSSLSDTDKTDLKDSRLVKLFRFHTYTDGKSGNDYRFRIKPRRLGDENLNSDFEKWSRFDVIVYKYNKNTYEFDELLNYQNINLNPKSEDYIGKVVGTQYEYYDFKIKKIISKGNYLKTNQHIYVEISDEIEYHNTDCTLIPSGFMPYPKININNQNIDINDSDSYLVNPLRFVGNLLLGKDQEENTYIKSEPYWGVLFDKTCLVEFEDQAHNETKLKFKFDMYIPRVNKNCPYYEYTKYFQDFKDSKCWVTPLEDGVEDTSNSLFHLEKILYTPTDSSINDSWQHSFYRRDGKDITNLTSNQSKQQEINLLYKYVNVENVLRSESLSDSSSSVYLSFDLFTYGGFDGINILDMHKRKIDNVSILREENNEVAGIDKGQSIYAYEYAINSILNDDFYRKDILCIPGIQSDYLTRKILNKSEELGTFTYVFDIKEYDSSNSLIFDEYYFKNIDNKVSERFDERFSIKEKIIKGTDFTYSNFTSKFIRSRYLIAVTNNCEASVLDLDNTQIVVPPSISYMLSYANTDVMSQSIDKIIPLSSKLNLNSPLNSNLLYQNNKFDQLLIDLRKSCINPVGNLSLGKGIKPLSSKTLLDENTNLFNLHHNVRILQDIKRTLKFEIITSDQFLFNNYSANNTINNLKINAEIFLSDIMQSYLDDNIIKNYNVNLKAQDLNNTNREILENKLTGEVSFSLFGNDNELDSVSINLNNLLENINNPDNESNITITDI